MRKRFITLAIASSSLCLINNQIANASLKDQYKSTSACTWETSTYERTWNWGSKTYIDRHCITADKKIIKFTTYSGTMAPGNKNKPKLQKGKLDKSESYVNKSDFTYYISEYAIEKDNLILYECKSTDGYKCSSTLDRYVVGTKIGI